MSNRDFILEDELLNIDESGLLNGFYMLSLLYYLGKCTFDELSTAMYLFRFVNVTHQLLSLEDQGRYWAQIPDWEKDNLDVMLVHVLIEKYNDRFVAGIRELMSREMIATDEQYVSLMENVRETAANVLWSESYRPIMHKAHYVSKLMGSVPLDKLKDRIRTIVGDM